MNNKKSFKNNPALQFITETQPLETPKTDEPQSTLNTHNTLNTQKPYRINLKLKGEFQTYLEHESWKAHKSITQYINDLIQADKDTKTDL